jgi:hypothetical protein
VQSVAGVQCADKRDKQNKAIYTFHKCQNNNVEIIRIKQYAAAFFLMQPLFGQGGLISLPVGLLYETLRWRDGDVPAQFSEAVIRKAG